MRSRLARVRGIGQPAPTPVMTAAQAAFLKAELDYQAANPTVPAASIPALVAAQQAAASPAAAAAPAAPAAASTGFWSSASTEEKVVIVGGGLGARSVFGGEIDSFGLQISQICCTLVPRVPDRAAAFPASTDMFTFIIMRILATSWRSEYTR